MPEDEKVGGCPHCGTPAHIGCECASNKQEVSTENEGSREARVSSLLELAGVGNLDEA